MLRLNKKYYCYIKECTQKNSGSLPLSLRRLQKWNCTQITQICVLCVFFLDGNFSSKSQFSMTTRNFFFLYFSVWPLRCPMSFSRGSAQIKTNNTSIKSSEYKQYKTCTSTRIHTHTHLNNACNYTHKYSTIQCKTWVEEKWVWEVLEGNECKKRWPETRAGCLKRGFEDMERSHGPKWGGKVAPCTRISSRSTERLKLLLITKTSRGRALSRSLFAQRDVKAAMLSVCCSVGAPGGRDQRHQPPT